LLTPDTRALLDNPVAARKAADEAAAGSNAAYKTDLDEEALAVDQTGESERTGRRICRLVEARYRLLKTCIGSSPPLGQDSIEYYAYGVIKAQIFSKLTRRAQRERYLHLIAFIAHQYYRLARQPGSMSS